MCGRYYVGERFIEKIQKSFVDLRVPMEYVYCGDITPAMKAPVIADRNHKPTLEQMTWGFEKYDGKGLIINARAETAMEKRMFRDSMLHRRILIPASGFYEWDRDKNKVTFTLDNSPILFLAGIYQRTEGSPDGRFVILTTGANASMEPVHDRMPLMIAGKDINAWLSDESEVHDLLRREMPQLNAERDYEQQSLF
ncbi:MAG: SOS response-associated peptidase [Lachnospiraceae bacterium]|nr:SOS response-associated peptidase [Lachnospiraceae bacterium]